MGGHPQQQARHPLGQAGFANGAREALGHRPPIGSVAVELQAGFAQAGITQRGSGLVQVGGQEGMVTHDPPPFKGKETLE
jgi:hypothetical protein